MNNTHLRTTRTPDDSDLKLFGMDLLSIGMLTMWWFLMPTQNTYWAIELLAFSGWLFNVAAFYVFSREKL